MVVFKFLKGGVVNLKAGGDALASSYEDFPGILGFCDIASDTARHNVIYCVAFVI